MSGDDTDSFIRAVAAAPPLEPPVRAPATPPVAPAPLAPESVRNASDDQIAAAIADERSLSARRLVTFIVVTVSLATLCNLMLSRKWPYLAPASPVYALWLVISTARWIAAGARRANAGWLTHTIYLIDVPMFFAVTYQTIRHDPGPIGTACFYLCWCVAIGATTQFLMQLRAILATAIMLAAASCAFFIYAGAGLLSFPAVMLIGFTIAIGIYAQARTRALLRRVVAETEERLRHVEAANRELQRQVAERARGLSEALARLMDAPRAPTRLGPGDVLDERYRIVRTIGAGGMGQVHEVERLTDGRRLALKTLTGVAHREALARFAREAQVAAELHHPNVVATLDIGVTGFGLLYFVMELVAGSSLAAQRNRYGQLPWVIPVLRQTAAALSAMHARGIVHRDLKPANILLDGTTVKVADFGLVAVIDQPQLAETLSPEAAAHPESPALTRTGAIMGTPLYMAPELAGGAREAGPSVDIFSFGVLAYQLLTKELPFATPPVLERLSGRAAPAPMPLAGARRDLPSELCALVDACLDEKPQARPTGSLIVDSLERMR